LDGIWGQNNSRVPENQGPDCVFRENAGPPNCDFFPQFGGSWGIFIHRRGLWKNSGAGISRERTPISLWGGRGGAPQKGGKRGGKLKTRGNIFGDIQQVLKEIFGCPHQTLKGRFSNNLPLRKKIGGRKKP